MTRLVWADDFSVNHFANGDYSFPYDPWPPSAPPAPHAPDQATIAKGALAVPSWGLLWWDTRQPVPANFTSATCWADIASADDSTVGMEIAVGLAGLAVRVGARPGGTPRMGTTDLSQATGAGTTGGLYVDESGNRMLGLDIIVRPVAPPTPASVADAAPGRVSLTLTAAGEITLLGPGDTQLFGSVAPATVAAWLDQPGSPAGLYPFVQVTGAAATLSQWGYEIDFPTPPSTVQSMGGQSGALRR